MKTRIAALMLALAATGLCHAASDLDALFAAERAFAAASPKIGMKQAFLAALSPDAVMYRPGPVNAVKHFQARPDVAPFVLEWAPEAGEVDGDLGYTYGPWKLTPRDAEGKTGEPAGGHFFSVWIRNADGIWKLHFDHGIGHGLQAFPAAAGDRGAGITATPGLSDELAKLDDALNALRASDQHVDALADLTAANAVTLRAESLPQPIGADAFVAMRGKPQRDHLRLSSGGRLAATVGHVPGERPQVYQRVWRHEASGWKLVVDLTGD